MNSKKLQFAILGILVFLPVAAFAQSSAFTPLIGIPGLTDRSGPLNFSDYINTLYALSISIAGLLAVIKIIIAGVKYMLSDVVTSKQSAIGDIKGALLGLLIVISAFLVLNVINPDLNETTLFLSPIDRATTNSSNARAGSGTGGPMPQIGNSPVSAPVAVEPFLCPGGTCDPARALCVSRGGRVETPGVWSNNGETLNCRLGDTRNLTCLQVENGATQQLEADCAAARASCSGANDTYTQIREYAASCFTRYPVPSP